MYSHFLKSQKIFLPLMYSYSNILSLLMVTKEKGFLKFKYCAEKYLKFLNIENNNF